MKNTKQRLIILALVIVLSIFLFGCTGTGKQAETQNTTLTTQNPELETQNTKLPPRESTIPADAIKVTPETDVNPPKSKSPDYADPVPLPAPVNTAGAEDSPFITPDGNTLYFFFTPDVRVPVEKQILDNVTGIYVSHKISVA